MFGSQYQHDGQNEAQKETNSLSPVNLALFRGLLQNPASCINHKTNVSRCLGPTTQVKHTTAPTLVHTHTHMSEWRPARVFPFYSRSWIPMECLAGLPASRVGWASVLILKAAAAVFDGSEQER